MDSNLLPEIVEEDNRSGHHHTSMRGPADTCDHRPPKVEGRGLQQGGGGGEGGGGGGGSVSSCPAAAAAVAGGGEYVGCLESYDGD